MAVYLAIKAICRRIEDRYGSGKLAAIAADVSPGVWSTYCSDNHPDTTIPFHRVPMVANEREKQALAAVLLSGGHDEPLKDLRTESCEATEAAAEAQAAAREYAENPTPHRGRHARDKAARALVETIDVVRAAACAPSAPRLRSVS